MELPGPYRVCILARPDRPPAEVDSLHQLLRDGGYRVQTGRPGVPDAVVLVGRGRLPVVVREMTGGLDCVPAFGVRCPAPGTDTQPLLLRVGVECRRGRLIRTRLAALGVVVFADGEVVGGGGAAARLTPVQFRLLRSVVLGAGEVVPRERLVRTAWAGRRAVPDATLDSHIRGVRATLSTGRLPLEIQTVRGVGYRWSVE